MLVHLGLHCTFDGMSGLPGKTRFESYFCTTKGAEKNYMYSAA